MEMQLCCGCAPPTLFTWQRHCRIVGPQTARAELADHDWLWEPVPGGAEYWINLPDLAFSKKVAPMRYEIGKNAIPGSWGLHAELGRTQANAAISDHSPPFTGHIRSAKITSLDVPVFTHPIYGGGSDDAAGYLNAVEVFRNGVSVGLWIFESPISINLIVGPNIFYKKANGPVHLELDAPLVVSTSDTWSFDLYATSHQLGTFPIGSNDMMRASVGSGFTGGMYMGFQSAATRYTAEKLAAFKFVFADNGPGGISELTMQSQAGWSYTPTGGSISMTRTGTTHQIDFVWNVEIPFIRYIDFSKHDNPSGTRWEMRYRPADSGDYESFRDYPGNSVDITLGRWNPNSPTAFSNLWRHLQNFDWYYATGNSLSTGFPSAITIQRV